MKRQINLYLDEFRPKPDPLALKWLALAWALSLVIIIIISVVLSQYQKQTAAQFDSINSKVMTEQAIVNEFAQAAAKRTTDPALETKILALNNKLQHKRKLINVLRNSGVEFSSGYADLMYDFARLDNDEIWLEHIEYQQNGLILLKGGTKTAAVLPSWLESLQSSNYFAGQALSDIQISYQESGQYNEFLIANEKQTTSLLNEVGGLF